MTRDELDITRWRGFSHADLHTQLQTGPGPGASATPAGRWGTVSATLNDIHHDLIQTITQARSMWAGEAADAAFAQLTEIADWAAPAALAAAGIQTALDQQADSVGRVRAAMPAPNAKPTPEPDPLLGPVLQVVGLQSDHERIDRATTDDARKAFQAMLTYQEDTTAAIDALPAYPEPINATGHDGHRDHSLLNILGIAPVLALAAPPVAPFSHSERGGDKVVQSSFTGTLTPLAEIHRPAAPIPLERGAMTAALDPFAPVAPAAQQEETHAPARRRSVPVPADPGSMTAAPVSTSSAASGPTSSVAGGGDRAVVRRESLMPGWTGGDAVEPVESGPRRRRDRPDEKITESVEGIDSQVPPPVIGTEPYRR